MSTQKPALSDILARFYRRTVEGIRPGLEIESVLLERLGHPETSLAVVHVAGTNGKGSVCAMIEAVARAGGLKTGLYTSPHLVTFNERIRVNGACISDEDLAGHLERMEALADEIASEPGRRGATFFELGTAMAFEHFRRAAVELAVIETGMGGVWDATNVVRPVVAVITRIDIDHTNYLGTTLEEIAGEKSGIIKPGRPVVVGPMPDAARAVLLSKAREERAPVVRAEEAVTVSRRDQTLDGQRLSIQTANGAHVSLRLPLLGRHQVENVAIAVAAIEQVWAEAGGELDPAAVKKGLEDVNWPARLQVLQKDPLVLLDGAHNPGGARSLAEALDELASGRRIALVAGFMRDKDSVGFMRILAPRLAKCWAVPVGVERAMGPGDVAASMRAGGVKDVTVAASVASALEDAVGWARAGGGVVCIAGSLYLAGEVLVLKKGRSLS
ncbi:MAG: bifunctional folylpolyglutamate synthase/dihydrofolate synthase [Kiritimatiellae bacterium]|nr:bifunctional folylpolyglutamate synthase/dihydrofolate synthase [Kiritimatiellia bacterium]